MQDRECVYYRLRVRNAEDKDSARGVHLKIEDVELGDDGALASLAGLEGAWLAWAGRELTNPRAERQAVDIAPGAAEWIDLVHLNQGVASKAIIDIRPQPTDKRTNRLGAGSVTLRLALHGDNLNPRRYSLELRYDGHRWSGWGEDSRAHLEVANLQEV